MKLFDRIGQKVANLFGESSPLDEMNKSVDFFDPDYFAEFLPYRMYNPETGIYDNATGAGFVIEAEPLLRGSEESERELSALIREISSEGSNIQFLLFADPRIGNFMNRWSEPRDSLGGLFETIAKKKKQFFINADIETPPRIFRFYISYSEKKPQKEDPAFFQRINEKKKKVLETFSRISKPLEVAPDQLLNLLSGLVNMGSSGQRKWNKESWLSKQVCIPGGAISVGERGLSLLGEKEYLLKTYEAIDVPGEWTLESSGELIGDFFNASYRIPAPFFIHYGIHTPSQERAEMQFKSRKKILEHQSKFPYASRMVPTLFKEIEENEEAARLLKEGEKFVETCFSCALFSEEKKFVQAESALLALTLKYGFVLKENNFVHFPDFLSSLPMAWGEDVSSIKGLKRVRCMRTSLTKETSALIPCVGEWYGNSPAGTILMGRKGQIACWDPFATDGNLNTVVVGPSGSGKSVFMQEMIMSHLGQGGRVFILDLGRSFEKLCTLLGGQYLAFSERSHFDLNPFRLIRSEEGTEALNSSLEIVSSIVATMAMPSQNIDKERADLLAGMVRRAWEKERENASVDTVIEMIEQLKFNSELMIGASESLKEGLKKFGKDGVYANFFYGTNSVQFNSNMVVVETEELKNMADLQAVILQIFTLTISTQIFMGDRKQKCLICIDEAWDLLKSPQMEGFIESLARRLRKYNGALVVGTQSIKDFERSAGARAAFQNSNWLVMLGKDNDSINLLKKQNLIPMDDFREKTLSSLRMESGKFSELCIYNKGTGAFTVHQLRLDPFSSMLYSTKASEFQAVMDLKKQGFSIMEAIEKIMAEKHR